MVTDLGKKIPLSQKPANVKKGVEGGGPPPKFGDHQ